MIGRGELIPEIGATELGGLFSGPEHLPIDPLVLDLMGRAKHLRQIRIVNGLVSGQLTAALRGEAVGTLVRA